MKRSLGRIIVLIAIIFNLQLSAYKWTTYASKQELYVNERVHLKYTCSFEDRGELYTIDFNPIPHNDTYDLTLLNKKDTFKDSKKTTTYEYSAKAKVSGKLHFDFHAKMKKTTLESIVYSSGSRDDDRGDDNFIMEMVSLNTLSVEVKENPSGIVGVFTLDVKADEKDVKAYEPYHLDITISGRGNFEDIKPLEYTIAGVKVFAQKPIKDVKLTANGYEGKWSQKFAFVGDKDFTIPSVRIEYLDTSIKTLDIQAFNIEVKESFKKEELLDEVEKYEPFSFSFVYYILTFIAGFLVAKIKFKKEKINTKEKILREKIKNAQTIDALSMILILNDERKYAEVLRELEIPNVISLSTAKKKVLKLIKG